MTGIESNPRGFFMHYRTEEKIQVGVICGGEVRMRPEWFVWKGKRYQVSRVNHVWKESQGRELLYFFSVSDAVNTYLLCYQAMNMEWKICGTYTEG
jgi:hypothetical protein